MTAFYTCSDCAHESQTTGACKDCHRHGPTPTKWCPRDCLDIEDEQAITKSPRIFVVKRNRQDRRVEQDIDNWQKHPW